MTAPALPHDAEGARSQTQRDGFAALVPADVDGGHANRVEKRGT